MKHPVPVACACCLLLSLSARACANSFAIVPDTTSANISNWSWKISTDGSGNMANPTLVVLTGSTYTFDVGTSPTHPFWIDLAPGLGGSVAASPYPVGDALSANGVTTSATIVMNLPADAPDTLYYACGYHAAMTGAIMVVHDLVFRSDFD